MRLGLGRSGLSLQPLCGLRSCAWILQDRRSSQREPCCEPGAGSRITGLKPKERRINPTGVHATPRFWNEGDRRRAQGDTEQAGWGSPSACIPDPASTPSDNTERLLPSCWSSPSEPPCIIPLLNKDLWPPDMGTTFSQAVPGSNLPC